MNGRLKDIIWILFLWGKDFFNVGLILFFFKEEVEFVYLKIDVMCRLNSESLFEDRVLIFFLCGVSFLNVLMLFFI